MIVLIYILLIGVLFAFLIGICGMLMSDTKTFQAIDERIANKIKRI
jgi:hypothetical protein